MRDEWYARAACFCWGASAVFFGHAIWIVIKEVTQ